MENYPDLFSEICSYRNLELAFKRAKKRKSLRPDVIEFEKNLNSNLADLRNELIFLVFGSLIMKVFNGFGLYV